MSIVSVMMKKLFLIVLWETLIERFGNSPIEYDGMTLKL